MEGVPKLSIATVSYNCRDFVELLVKSVKRFTSWPYELIVIDNNSTDGTAEFLEGRGDVRAVLLPHNVGHGQGLNFAFQGMHGKYGVFFDADVHVMRAGWEDDLLTLYRADELNRLVAAAGTPDPDVPMAKPIHPFFMFFEVAQFANLEPDFRADSRHDVARKVFYDLRDAGYKTVRVEAGAKHYPGAYGCTYHIAGKPTFYHNWYSSRMWKKTKVDDYERVDFDNNKSALFSAPLVQDILAEGKQDGEAS